VAEVARNFQSYPGILAVTMLKGRERRDSNGILSHCSHTQRRKFRVKLRRQGIRGKRLMTEILRAPFDPMGLIRAAEAHGRVSSPYLFPSSGRGHRAVARQIALREAVASILIAEGTDRHVRFGGVYEYHSRSTTHHGTPFMTTVFIIGAPHQNPWMKQVHSGKWMGGMVRDSLPVSTSLELLAPTAAQLAKDVSVEFASRLFRVPPRTIIAWKAHHTRGTYTLGSALTMDPVEDLDAVSDEMVLMAPPRLGKPLGSVCAPQKPPKTHNRHWMGRNLSPVRR
jgi:hypothetical protein